MSIVLVHLTDNHLLKFKDNVVYEHLQRPRDVSLLLSVWYIVCLFLTFHAVVNMY